MIGGKEKAAEIIPLLQTRLFAYDVLRRTFIEAPSAEYFKAMRQPGMLEEFPFSQENQTIAEGIIQASHYLNQKTLAQAEVDQNICSDYTRLFIGPAKLAAPPWESAYTSEQKLLFQEETLQVRYVYRKYGLKVKNYQQEAEDHIGLELDFMYHLAQLALSGIDDEERDDFIELVGDARHFLSSHLLQWVPGWSRDVIDNANTGFYQGMALILKGYLEVDLLSLDELLEYWTQ